MSTVAARQPEGRPTTFFSHPLKVVELGEDIPTSVCGRLLLKMGATVTRVRPVGFGGGYQHLAPTVGSGDSEVSTTAAWLDDGKTVVDMDLADAADAARLDELLAEADVVLITGRSALWAGSGRSISEIEAAAPTAVIGHYTPWGDTGPYVDLHVDELQLQAMGGLMKLIGKLEREPIRLGGRPMRSTSGLMLLSGVMIGLFRRSTTGEGARFSTSGFESVAHVEWKIASFVQNGDRRELRGEDGGGPVVVRTLDGHFAFFFVPANWKAVKQVVDDPRLEEDRFATPAGRAANQGALAAIIEETTSQQSKKDLYYRCQALGIPAGHVATMQDLLDSPQYRARESFESIEIAGVGVGEVPNVPWQVLTADAVDAEGGDR